MQRNRKILITGARAPVALHLARLLSEAGHQISMADSLANPISRHSKYCGNYFQLSAPRFAFEEYATALVKAVKTSDIDIIIPTCEEIFYIAALKSAGRLSCKVFAPDFNLLARAHNKFEFIQLCKDAGLCAPKTHLIIDLAALLDYQSKSSDYVFKPVWSRFANQVLIRPKWEELKAIEPTTAHPWIAQEFLQGTELSVYAFANGGVLRGLSVYRSLYRAGKGAGVCFEPIEDDEISLFVEAFLKATNWTGQISFDFVKRSDGSVVPLESNPRATSGVHFFQAPTAFASAFLDGAEFLAPDVSSVQTVPGAQLIYGLPKAIARFELSKFIQVYRTASDVLAWPGDKLSATATAQAFAEITRIALRNRCSLQAASTRDIEWNGDPITQD